MQKFQIFFIPIHIHHYFYIPTLDVSESIVAAIYEILYFIPASIIVFIVTQIKLSKYEKFELPQEEE